MAVCNSKTAAENREGIFTGLQIQTSCHIVTCTAFKRTLCNVADS